MTIFIASRPGYGTRLRRSRGLMFERLEDRALLTELTYHGGPVLTHIDVQPIFYGSYWTNTAVGQQTATALMRYLDDMVNAPPEHPGMPSFFLSTPLPALADLPGTTGDVLAPQYPNFAVNLDQQIDDSYISGILRDAPNSSHLDLFFAPPGSWVSAGSANSLPGPGSHFLAYHSYKIGTNGVPIYYDVITFPGWPNIPTNLTPFDEITVAVSHELAETITDPQGNAWYDDSLGPSSGETGDVCPGNSNYLLFRPSIYLPSVYLTQAVWFNQLGYGGLPGIVDGSYYFSPHPEAQSITASLGQSYQGILANFSRAGSSPSSFSAQITWGDGTTSNGQVVPAGDGSYNVVGDHTFTTSGDYLANVVIKDQVDGTVVGGSPDITVSGIRLRPAAPNTVKGSEFHGAIGTFSDPNASSGTYQVTIDWGDGGPNEQDAGSFSTSKGTVVPNGDGTFSIVGDHTYASPGTYTISYSLAKLTTGLAPLTVRGSTMMKVTVPNTGPEADFDGDGKADLSVFQPATETFYVKPSSDPSHPYAFQFGQGLISGSDMIPIVGDFDGDGKADNGLFDPSTSTFYITRSSDPSNSLFQETQFGQGTLYGGNPIPIVGDFDGDGKADIAVFQPSTSTFYIKPSSDPSHAYAVQFGQGTRFRRRPDSRTG